jgi:hypothetical protein
MAHMAQPTVGVSVPSEYPVLQGRDSRPPTPPCCAGKGY